MPPLDPMPTHQAYSTAPPRLPGRGTLLKTMLLSIQYPFADSRKFIAETGRLSVPGWPLPTPNSEFVRFFGGITIRRRCGIEGWIGENEICEGDQALRFSTNLSYIERQSGINIILRCAFRRFYFDGWAVGKYEVGIAPKQRGSLDWTKDNIRQIISHFLHLPVLVRKIEGGVNDTKLIYAGKYLAQLYAGATKANNSAINSENWWVLPGIPILFLQFDQNEEIHIPYWSKPISLSEDYSLFHCLVPYEGMQIRMWILGDRRRIVNYRDSRHDYYYNTVSNSRKVKDV